MVMRISRRRNRLLDWVFWLTCVCVWSLLVVMMSMVMLVTRLSGLVYAEIIVESNSRNNYG